MEPELDQAEPAVSVSRVLPFHRLFGNGKEGEIMLSGNSLPFVPAPAPRTSERVTTGSTGSCQEPELSARRESVEKRFFFIRVGRSLSELSMAAQVSERHLRRILEQLKAECRITFKGYSVIDVPAQEPEPASKRAVTCREVHQWWTRCLCCYCSR